MPLARRRGERVFRDSLIAREASTSRTALAGALAALILLGVPLVVLALNALIGACGDLMRDNVAAPLTALWDVAVGYVRTVGPWLLPIVAFGALLAWLRRHAACRGYILILTIGPTQQMRFGLQSAFPHPGRPDGRVDGCPAAGSRAATRHHRDPAGGAFPLWILSGVAVDVAWEGRDGMVAAATVSAPAGNGDDSGVTHGAAGGTRAGDGAD